jgi:enamine deaminase RidA (YjgF/YER057c/UK114 family)
MTTIRHVNPDGLPHSPAFSQAVVVESPAKTIYVGGQNGVGADNKPVGPTLLEQARQAFANIATILATEGATLANVVSWTITVVDGQPVQEGFGAFQEAWDPADPPPAIMVQTVPSMVNPDLLCEIGAVAVV